jgi:hypothetical protein
LLVTPRATTFRHHVTPDRSAIMGRRKSDDPDTAAEDTTDTATVMEQPAESPMRAADRLRAFEDEHFGKDAVRIDGQIERGVGSPFASMTDEDRAKYGALERLVVAEQKLADAHAALVQADADHEAAETEANA